MSEVLPMSLSSRSIHIVTVFHMASGLMVSGPFPADYERCDPRTWPILPVDIYSGESQHEDIVIQYLAYLR